MALIYDKLLGKLREKDESSAASSAYDNTSSGLTADNVQAAIDELDSTMDAYRFKKRIGTWDPADPFPGGASTLSGHYWVVDTPGTRDGVEFTLEDKLVALVDSPSTTVFAANWEKEDDLDPVDFEYEVAFVEVEEVLQLFRKDSSITGIDVANADTVAYDINETGSFTTLTLPGDLPLAISAGDTVTWQITYSSGKDKASLNIIGTEV